MMTKKQSAILLVIFCLLFFVYSFAPLNVSAAGLIPCGTEKDSNGKITNPCQPCHIFSLLQNVLNFLWWYISMPLAALFLSYGGLLMVVPGFSGNAKLYDKGKKVITNALIGLVIIFFSWLAIDTIIKAIAGQPLGSGVPATIPKSVDEGPPLWGPWNAIQCNFASPTSNFGSRATPVADTNFVPLGARDKYFASFRYGTNANSLTKNIVPYQDKLNQLALQNNVNPDDVIALIGIESGGNPNIGCSSKGSCGLMQLQLDTARQYDSSITQTDLVNNSDKNLAIGIRHYSSLLHTYNDVETALAAYNGGDKAVAPSRDCPGIRAYQCPWDSSGCWQTTKVDCTPNTGYAETRKYITSYRSYKQSLEQLKTNSR